VPRYVAISHVWSDGMGNQERNAMPLCVLRKIQRQVNSLFDDTDEPVLFWIDTICVLKTNKVPALEIMAQTYAFATMVLAIDAGLESVSVESSPLERLIRIRTSPWFQRLWTLQEAWFARDLAFQFAEAACEMESLVLECFHKPSPMRLEIEDMLYLVENRPAPLNSRLVRGLAADSQTYDIDESKLKGLIEGTKRFDADFPTEADKRLGGYINRFTKFDPVFWGNAQMILDLRDKRDNTVENGQLKVRKLHSIFSAIKNRQTSRKEDEPYCLANLMGIDVKPILAEEPADRMPATIIFSHNLEHMDEEGFSWAPKSFMGSDAVSYGTAAKSLGRIHSKGLRICMPGLRMKAAQFSGPSHFEYGLGVVGDIYAYQLVLSWDSNLSVLTWNQFNGRALMVIVRQFTSDQVGQNRIGDTVDGALVSFLKRDDGVDVVKFLTTVWIIRTGIELAKKPGYPLGEWLGAEHEWCVW
jgi:hypothetical protein